MFLGLDRTPMLGRSRSDLGQGVRVLALGNFPIVYRATEDRLFLSRVIHGRRDLARHFEECRCVLGGAKEEPLANGRSRLLVPVSDPMTGFSLHPRLAADTHHVGDLPLCSVLLMDDARFPWLVLVPRRPDLREIVDLTAAERAVLIEEIATASRALQRVTGAEKLNTGAIGNVVPQLHIHVVARFAADLAWPAPVWGRGAPVPYGAAECSARMASLAVSLGFMSEQ